MPRGSRTVALRLTSVIHPSSSGAGRLFSILVKAPAFASSLVIVAPFTFPLMVTTRSSRRLLSSPQPPESDSPLVDEATTKNRRRTTTKRTVVTDSKLNLTAEGGGDAGPPSSIDRANAVLFALDDLIPAKLVARPSKRNRSPYVADVYVESLQREAVCHVPNLDMGGKCVPGVAVWIKRARDPKGRLVGPNAVSGKYGTPKCEFILQLLCVDESHLSPQHYYPPTLVGAHPSLGERIAREWLQRDLISGIPPVASLRSQVTMGSSRFDFVLTHVDGSKRVVEVKTVVDADYAADAPPPSSVKCRYLSSRQPYERTAIFPWGQSKQKGPDGEAVVSARAIHHVQQLAELVQQFDPQDYQATILFVVVRGDATRFRPNAGACPSFVRHLRLAQEAGVHVAAKRIMWGNTDLDRGTCYSDADLAIVWPGDDDGVDE